MKTRSASERPIDAAVTASPSSVSAVPARRPSATEIARQPADDHPPAAGLAHHAPHLDQPKTVEHGPIAARIAAQQAPQQAIRQAAFSRAPEELSTLLRKEVTKACDFVNQLRAAFTFFGGARIEKSDPLFAAGKRWGEALLLANLTAEEPALAARAIGAGVFSEEAVRASRAAIVGLAAGFHGPRAIGRALASVGDAASPEGMAHAIAELGRSLVEAKEIRLLLGLAPRPKTGAGPGMMDAVPLGYVAARQKLLETFPDLPDTILEKFQTEGAVMGKLASEEKKSESIDQREVFFHFVSRRLALMEGAVGLVVFPGGIGTLNEIFEAARDGIPLVFDGREFWKESLDVLTTKWKERGLVTGEDLAFFDLVDGVEHGLPYLLKSARPDRILDPEELTRRGVEMAKELEHGLDRLAAVPTAVTFVGGRNLKGTDGEVKQAARLAERLSGAGVPMRVGGWGAVFDAVTGGTRAAGHDPKDSIQALLHDRGDVDLAKVAASTKDAEVVHSAMVHKLLMYENTSAIVALPGGKGTFDEVFEVACLMVTGNLPERPLVLVGREFWQPFLDACEKVMDTPDRPVVQHGAFQGLFQVVDTADEAEAILRAR